MAPELRSARVGMVTNDVARTTTDAPSRKALLDAGMKISRLFGPEHGIGAVAADGAKVGDSTDTLTGLPVTSLYGATHKPPAESLKDMDVLMFDIPDVGARFYTYIWTLSYVLEAAAESGKPLWVLDRPNPIGGDLSAAEGPMLEESFVSSFVGRWCMPIRHCLTVGELARLWNAQKNLGADVRVVQASGWTREMHWPATGLEFVAPSPNMPSYESALLYPGTCLIEGTNLSEGRGTDAPFQLTGAPWVDADCVAGMFNDCGYEGVVAEAVQFVPAGRKFEKVQCGGVKLRITDAKKIRPVSAGLALVGIFARLYPDEMQWHPYPTGGQP